MQTLLETAELKIIELERQILEIKQQNESKQSERILSNHGWMTTIFEERIMPRTKELKEALLKVKQAYSGEFKITTQFDVPILHCEELTKLLNEILYLYKIRASSTDLKLRFQNSLPKIVSNMASLKNRFYIIKGNVSRTKKLDEEDIFG